MFDKSGGTAYTYSAITKVNDSGQYSVTLKDSSNGAFIATVDYTMPYTFSSTSTNVTVRDKSNRVQNIAS